MREKSRLRKWLVITSAVLLLGIGALAAVVYWGLRRPEFRAALSQRVDHYLSEQLGESASIGDVRVGWNSITLSDLAIPLSESGSKLLISELEFGVVTSELLRAPTVPLRSMRSVRTRGVELIISVAASGSDDRPTSVTRMALPESLYPKLQAIDSLRSVVVENCQVSIENHDSTFQVASDLYLTLDRDGSDLKVSGSGQYLADPRNLVTLSGIVSPAEKSADLSLLLDIPNGPLPLLEKYSATSTGGRLSARISADDTVATLDFSLSLQDAFAMTAMGGVHTDRIRVTSIGDTLRLEPLSITTERGSAVVSGDFQAATRDLNLSARAKIFNFMSGNADSVSATEAPIELDIQICGALSQPTISLRSPSVNWGRQQFHDVMADALFASNKLYVTSLIAQHAAGTGEVHGELMLDSTLTWAGDGRITLDSGYVNRQLSSRVSVIEFSAEGQAARLSADVSLFSNQRVLLGEGRLSYADAVAELQLNNLSGESGRAIVYFDSGRVSASAEHAQVILAAVMNDPSRVLRTLDSLELEFSGNADSGALTLRTSLHPDSLTVLPQIVRELQFTGGYQRTDDESVTFNGTWSGVNGNGQPFDGSADVSLSNRVLILNRMFIDQASSASGQVDFANSELDLQFEIVDLPFDKLPLQSEFLARARLAGNASGLIRVQGEFHEPEWTAHLAVVEGAVFGVPDYWINFEAEGRGLTMDLRQFELGRDIRRILVAQGRVDIQRDSIAVTVESGAGNAEDFVTALLGRSGIVSGALEGRAAISGMLSRPEVEVELTVSDGQLVNQIGFTNLNVSGQVSVQEDGAPVIRVTHFQMQNGAIYSFAGRAEAVARTGGMLQVHLEGSGDFLNILDQMDREFASFGSQGSLELDVGGTVDHPQFAGGTFQLRDGQFTFPSATPVPIDVNMEFHVSALGIVESGVIALSNGDQFLNVLARDDWATAYPGLQPLIIPSPRINLGVLEFTTGIHGMPVRIPGLMKPEWIGQVTTGADGAQPIVISAQSDSTLLISGDVELRNARVTFPFVGGSGRKPKPVTQWLLDRLTEARWKLDLLVGSGNHYDVEITGLKNSDLFASLRDSPVFSTLADYFDHLSVDAVVDPTQTPLEIRETIQDSSFYLNGRLTSSRGRVEYLDQRFTIDYATCDFDETDIMPVLEGRASTMGTVVGVDSVSRRVPVYLTMYVIDRETQIRQRRGRLDDLTFVLEDDAGNPPENVLALLGYDVGTVGGKAQDVVTTSVVRAIGRQWIQPIERRLEKWTMLDEVTLNPAGGRSASLAREQRRNSATEESLQNNRNDQTLQSSGMVRFFTGSQLTVGKYLTNDVFLAYTGELSESESAPETGRLSLVHLWNLEYRIKPVSPDLVLDFAVEYDEFERRRDESVSLKYSFALEP